MTLIRSMHQSRPSSCCFQVKISPCVNERFYNFQMAFPGGMDQSSLSIYILDIKISSCINKNFDNFQITFLRGNY